MGQHRISTFALLLLIVNVGAFVAPSGPSGRIHRSPFVARPHVSVFSDDSADVDTKAEEQPTTEVPSNVPEASVEEESSDVNDADEEDKPTDDPSIVSEDVPVAEEISETSDAETSDEDKPQEAKRKIQRERHTVFVGNLPFDVSDADVNELFSEFGKVELVSVPKNKNTGRPRGFAFCDMGSPEEVETVVEKLDQTMFGGRVIRVNKSLPKEQIPLRKEKKSDEGVKKIYVGNLPFEITQEELTEFYNQYGEVFEVYIPVRPDTGLARGYAFVSMKEEDIEKAIEATSGEMFQGRKLTVSIPLPPGEKSFATRSDRTKLYVGNLSFYTVADTLIELFEEFGTVHDCFMPEDTATGSSRGFAFITLDNEAAMRAIDELDGCELDGRIIRVNESQPRGRKASATNDDEEEFGEEASYDEDEA